MSGITVHNLMTCLLKHSKKLANTHAHLIASPSVTSTICSGLLPKIMMANTGGPFLQAAKATYDLKIFLKQPV